MLVFLLLDCVGEVFSYMACFIPQIRAGARVDGGNVEQKRLILESRVLVKKCPRLRCTVHTSRVQSAVLFASSLPEGPCIFNNKLELSLAKGSSQCLVEHPIVSERVPSLLCARYGVEARGFLPVTIAMTHLTNEFHRVMRPQVPA